MEWNEEKMEAQPSTITCKKDESEGFLRSEINGVLLKLKFLNLKLKKQM